MTTTNLIRGLALALSLSPAVGFAAERLALLPAQAGDQVPEKLAAKAGAKRSDIERAPVIFAWALDPQAAIARPAPPVSESREYWRQVDVREIRKGVDLHTTMPGAVLRLSPLAGAPKRTPDPQRVVLQRAGGTYVGAAAFEQLADASALKAAGLGFPERTIAFKLRDELGAGDFRLALPDADTGMLVHVFEPDSQDVLALGSARDNVLQGEWLEVSAGFASTSGKQLGEVVGTIAAPNGKMFDLAFERQPDSTWTARTRIDAAGGAGEGLWEVHALGVSDDGKVRRDVRTAFSAAVPTARLAGSARIAGEKNADLRVSFPLEVAAASRYNLAGLLYGSDAQGTLRPIAIAHAAAWIEPGMRALTLSFAADLVRESGIGAPYELRDLSLTDQATLGLIERRARALRFDVR